MEINEQLIQFLSESPTCFHAVDAIGRRLKEAGYKPLYENEKWELQEGGKYYVTRNGSSVIAFRIPSFDFRGFMVSASHSDSPI